MKFWQSTAFNNPEELPEIAKAAEAAGFEGILLAEHLFVPETYDPAYLYTDTGRPDFDTSTPLPDPWVTIATLAAQTTKLRFCTLVQILPLHHPLEVAKSLATLSMFSQDRVLLGAGAGWMKEEFEALGVDFKSRGRRFNEMIEVMREVWTGEPVEYHGEFFDFPPLTQTPAPIRPIPILIGGASKAALKRAGRTGDGWCGAGNTLEEAEEILSSLRDERQKAGREDEPFECIVPLMSPPDPDTFKKISDLGATSSVNYPFKYTVGPDATLQQKLDVMKQFGDQVIGPCKDI